MRRSAPALAVFATFALLGVGPAVAAAGPTKQVKTSATLTYWQMAGDPSGCLSGIGVVVGPVAGAKSYVVSYYDGYYKMQESQAVTRKQLVEGGTQTGLGGLFFGITGGGGSLPCNDGPGDATEGGRFSKGAKAVAIVPRDYKPKPPNGVDWRMPPRLAGEVKSWTASEGLPARDEVHPKKWHVAMFLTRNGQAVDSCPSGKWEWRVDPPKDAKVVDKPGNGCKTSMDVSQLGEYKLTVTNRKHHATVDGKVEVKDWLIAGFGDSNGSGEGNPPFEFERCNRGLASYQYLVAQYVESHDPRSSVTFLWASCSGAIIQDLYKTHYEGINPNAGLKLQPQIKQVAYLAERHSNDPKGPDRKVDAAIVSIGVNNLGFGPLLAYCVLNFSPSDPCERRLVLPTFNVSGGVDEFNTSDSPQSASLQDWIQRLTNLLPATYAPLAHALAAPLNSDGGGTLGLPRSHVVITQYPDFTRGDDGQPCSGTIGPTSTWAFVGLAAANLDAAVAQAATANGWRPVLLPQSVFTGPPAGHGYCSSVPYFVTLNTALAKGNKPGAFHPNGSGHFATAQATAPQVCDVLYGNPKCDGKP